MKKTLFSLLVLMLAMGLVVACGDDDDEIEDGALGGACLEDGSCNEGLACNLETGLCEDAAPADGDEPEDGDTPEDGDAPEDGDTPEECVDDDCPGIQMCADNACSADVAAICLEGKFNEACPGATEFSTVKHGECAEIACDADDDCAELGTCDDPEAGSTNAFVCGVEDLCIRDI